MMVAKRLFLAAMCGLSGLLMLGGCMSDHPGSSSLAYVDIKSGTEAIVREGIVNVFEDDGYLLSDSVGDMVFERSGTQRDKMLFSHYGDDSLVMRVMVSVEPRRQGGFLVRANAYAIRDGQKEPVPKIARRTYQNQLNRVKANLVKSEGVD